MKNWIKFLSAVSVSSLVGCTVYDGAVYSSYQQLDLSIRSQPETATPVRLNFGFDQAVASFVPHRDDRHNGEAVSLFGSNNTESINVGAAVTAAQANVAAAQKAAAAAAKAAEEDKKAMDAAVMAQAEKTPAAMNELLAKQLEASAASQEAEAKAGESVDAAKEKQAAVADPGAGGVFGITTLLKAQGKFATGNAAKVLVIPKETNVVIIRKNGDEFSVPLTGDSATRVANAFSPTTRFESIDDQSFDQLARKVEQCKNKTLVYDHAAAQMGACFNAFYRKKPMPRGRTTRFGFSQGMYLLECKGSDEENKKKLNNALVTGLGKCITR